jgi:predicted Zn-dependent protease
MIKARTSIRSAADLLYAWSKEFPNDPQPHYLLAKLSLQLMDMEVASAELQQVLELDPGHAKGSLAMGDLLLEKQDVRGALEMYEIAGNDKQTRLAALVKQAQCQRILGQTPIARSTLEIVLQEDSSSPAANLELAHLELAEGKLESAIRYLQQAIQRDKNNHEARYTLARALRATGHAEEARFQFKLAKDSRAALVRSRYLVRKLVSEPNNSDLRADIGCTILAHGDADEAVDWLNSALAINPRHQATLRALVQYYESQSSSSESSRQLADEYRKRLDH